MGRYWVPMSAEVKDQAVALHRAGYNLSEVGRQLGYSREAIRLVCVAAGQETLTWDRSGGRTRCRRLARAVAVAAGYELRDTPDWRLWKASHSGVEKRTRPTDRLIADLQSVAEKLGRTPTHYEYDDLRGHGAPTWQTFRLRFGSWNKAVAAAGLDVSYPRRRYKRISKRECMDAVRYVRDVLGYEPTASDYDRFSRANVKVPSLATVRQRCGGWSNVNRMLKKEGPGFSLGPMNHAPEA